MKKISRKNKLIFRTLIILVFAAAIFFLIQNYFYTENSNKTQIEKLTAELRNVSSAEEEAEVINALWEIAYEDHEINLGISAMDSEGESVITNLSAAVEPVDVTVRFSSGFWTESVKFVLLDLDNVYLFLNE